jgi:undecaprenyl-diphosphatase
VVSGPGARRALEGFDEWVDQKMEPCRGRPIPDAAAALFSTLGDHGLVWFLVLVSRSRRPGHRRRVALRAVAFTGAVVPVVNASLKALVGRGRPALLEPVPGVRAPRTASFPSGHTLAAWCAASLLADGDRAAPGYYALAAAVSLSRVHVRHHHASDVVAGSLLGLGLGRLGRRLVPLHRV